MKKAYHSPTIIVVHLRHLTTLLAGSPEFKVNEEEESVNPEETW